AIHQFPASAAVLFFCIFVPISSGSVLSELSALQSQSPNGVIHLHDELLRRILSLPPPRPFHALVFFDAQKLHSKPDLSLATLRSEFALLASSFQLNNPNEKSQLFFFEIEFQESQSSFQLFGVNSLPHVRLIPPSASNPKTDSIPMDSSDFSRLADSMADFVAAKTKFSVGQIHRPPVISKKQIALIVALILIWIPFFLKKLIAGQTILHKKWIWMAGAIFIYFFSVSGAMFNIIRKMPMVMGDRQNPGKMVFFYQGSGMQLGAEGFAIGFLYTIVGLFLGFFTHILVAVKNRNVQRLVMMLGLFISFWAVKKVISLDNWKTGYGIHGYWPSSW
ncbi:hypothetical protein M569_05738, partial [Genlisea aurea]